MSADTGPRDRREHHRVVLYRARVPQTDEVHEATYESMADALHFACRDLRAGRREPLEIREDGELLLDAERIAHHCAEEWLEVEELLDPARRGAQDEPD